MSKRRLCAWFGVACLVVAGSVSARAVQAQTLNLEALQQQFERERGRSEELLAVESDRAGFAAQLGVKWAPLVRERGFTTEELVSVARQVPAERLLAASRATTYEGAVATLFGLSAGGPRVLGDTNSDLVFFPVTPCRLFDTRFSVAGILAANTARTFAVNGDLVPQGGDAAGCGIPTDPAAVVVTLTITEPQGFGNLRAFAFSSPVPNASVINYQTGQLSLANTTVVPVCMICGVGLDISVQADVSATHVLGDVVGYFWSPNATALDVIGVTNTAVVPAFGTATVGSGACPAGRTLTGGGFVADNAAVLVYGSVGFLGQWACLGNNLTGVAHNLTCQVVCTRVPGR